MGAELSNCGCHAHGRSDGKLDASWEAPPSLLRSRSHTSRYETPRKGFPGQLPSFLGRSPPSPDDVRTGLLDVYDVRVLAARLLSDAKNGRCEKIREMIDCSNMDADQCKELLSATDQSAGNTMPAVMEARMRWEKAISAAPSRPGW